MVCLLTLLGAEQVFMYSSQHVAVGGQRLAIVSNAHRAHANVSQSCLCPTTLNQLSSARALEVLCLAHNGLTGPVPQSFGGLAKLKVLNISNNKVTGESSFHRRHTCLRLSLLIQEIPTTTQAHY